jgi:hypothetical protein
MLGQIIGVAPGEHRRWAVELDGSGPADQPLSIKPINLELADDNALHVDDDDDVAL